MPFFCYIYVVDKNAGVELMLSYIKKTILFLLISAFLFQPSFANVGDFYFRYKPGLMNAGIQPQLPDEEDRESAGNYDVDAHFHGIVGSVFNSTVPTKPGAQVVSWEALGSFPAGLSFNTETGNISGTPTGEAALHKLDVIGYGISGGMDTFASVTINIEELREGALHQNFFARTSRDFFTLLQGGENVNEWVETTALPSWARIENGYLMGKPEKVGQWPVALAGRDYNGREVTFVYGNLVVDDGPEVNFISDIHQHISKKFTVVPSVNRAVGNILWSVEGTLPQSLSFDSSTGKIEGYINDFSATFSLKYRAIDLGDGSSGLSNDFVLSTQDPALNLDKISKLDFTVNTEKHFVIGADEAVGDQVWSLGDGELPPGITLNEVTGEIGGLPTTVGKWDGVVIQLTTSSSVAQSNPFSVEVYPDQISGSIPAVHVRVNENFTSKLPDVKGGVGPYSFATSENIHDGVVFDEETGGFSGKIETKGNYSFSITPKDQTGREGSDIKAQLIVYDPLSVDVEQDVYVFDRLRPAKSIHGITPSYSVIPNANWKLVPENRALPSGLVFHESGVISGTPAVGSLGHYGMYQMELEDGSGARAQSRPFQIHIVDIDEMELRTSDVIFQRLISYSIYVASASNNIGEVRYSLHQSSAPLPAGLSITADGRLSGVTTATADVEGVVLRGVDSDGREAVSSPFKISIRQPDPMEVSSVKFVWAQNIEFVTSSPKVTNAVGEIVWQSTTALPSWASLNVKTGQISGIIDTPGVYGPYSLRTTDIMGRTGFSEVTINVLPPLEMTIDPEFSGNRLSNLTVSPIVSNAVGNLTWKIETAVPSGTTFSRGTLSGTPLEEGLFPLIFTVVDIAGQEKSVSTNLTVRERLPLSLGYGNRTAVKGREILIKPDTKNAAGSVKYSLEKGSLPPGLRLIPTNGNISGIPTQAGYWRDIVIKGSDKENVTAVSTPFTIKVTLSGEIGVADPSFRTARVNRHFTSAGVAVGNVLSPLTFSTNFGGPLPDSEVALIASTGQLTGTPSVIGNRSYTLKVTDHLERSKTFKMQLKVVDALKITMGHVTTPLYAKFTATPSVNNAVGLLNWSIASGTLPAGLSLNPSTGAITGHAEAQGAFPLVLEAEDQFDRTTASASFTLTVGARTPLKVTMANVNTPQYNSFEAYPVVTGVAFSYTASLSAQSLPDGVQFDSATGRVYGQPTEMGSFGPYTLTVTDARGATSNVNFSITVGNRIPLSVTFGTLRPVMGKSFVSNLPSVAGAYGAVSYSLEGVLPQGMSFSNGRFLGTPTEVGLFEVQVTAADRAESIQVPVVLKVSYQNGMKVDNPPQYKVRNRKNFTIPSPSIVNGVGSRVYAAISGLQGLTLNPSTGELSGSISQPGTYEVTLSVEDEIGQKANFMRSIRIYGDLSVVPLDNAKVLANHSFSLSRHYSNAIGNLEFELAEGILPPGLTFTSSTGRITGIATELGTWSGIVLRATDVDGDSVSTTPLTMEVVLDGNPISLTTTTVTTKPGFPFATGVPVVSNTIGDWSFRSPQAEALGLSVNSQTGVISGIIQSTGDKIIDLDVTDSTNRVTSQVVRINVTPVMTVTYPPVVELTVLEAMTNRFPVTSHNIGAVSYKLEGKLPIGINFLTTTGRLSGITSEQGLTDPIRVIATDSVGDVQASNWFRLNVMDNGQTPGISIAAAFSGRAGTPISPITPSSQRRKIGDVISINMALPDGLELNPGTGVISGSPAIGSHGVYAGYRLRITDVNGRFAETNSFTISIKSDQDAGFKVYKTIHARKDSVISTPIPSYYPEHVVGNIAYSLISPAGGSVDEFGVWTGKVSGDMSIRIRPRDQLGNHEDFYVTIKADEPTISYVPIKELGGSMVERSPVLSNIIGTPIFSLVSNTSGLILNAETGEISGNIFLGEKSVVVRVTDSFDGLSKDFNLSVAGTVNCTPDFIKSSASIRYSGVNQVDDFMCRFTMPEGRVNRALTGTFYRMNYDASTGNAWCMEAFKNISFASRYSGDNTTGAATTSRLNSNFSLNSNSLRGHSHVTCRVS